jgi:hypothetical protein
MRREQDYVGAFTGRPSPRAMASLQPWVVLTSYAECRDADATEVISSYFLLVLTIKAAPCRHANIRAWPGGTIASPRCFPRMRIREENCNMVLLAVVTCISVTIAGGVSLLGSGDTKAVRFADRTTNGLVERAPSPVKAVIYVNDQPPVRVIGAPFVPNTNPRER